MTEPEDQSTLIKDIMTSPVMSVTLNTTVNNVLKLAKEKNVTGFPVVDFEQNVIGIVSTLDIITEVAAGKLHLKLGELPLIIKVEKDVIKLSPETPVKKALFTIIRKRVGRIIIVDSDNRLCGIVSRKDLINFFIDINKLA
ncbi:MAG: CBS domain-containing protein [Gammaproteobacteria bacterium]|nr:CBS domain-containing protein [Gammaproteobacteria bacterium]